MTSRLHDAISIDVIFDKPDNNEENGSCTPYQETGNPRIFDVRIDHNLSERLTLETLAHEMVHVKQFARGELYEYERHPKLYRWKKDVIDINKVWTWFRPWEIEAGGMEHGLYRLFAISELNYQDKETKSAVYEAVDKISARGRYTKMYRE